MRYLALVALLAIGVSGVSPGFAQSPPPEGPRSINREMAHLTRDLQLTPAQQAEILPILQQQHDSIQALFAANPTASRQDLAPQIHAISAETHRQIEALLTPTQQQLAQEMMAHMH
jgi:periplasmic protein CpxP/Spy